MFSRKNLMYQRLKMQLIGLILAFACVGVQPVYSQCMKSECIKMEHGFSSSESTSPEDIMKEARKYLSEKQIADIVGFGKEINSNIPQINPNWSCQKSVVSEEGLDLGALSERYSSTTAKQDNIDVKPELFVFVSNSMPEESLKQWSQQVERADGTLVLRGFIDNSPKKTVERVIELFGKEETSGFSIDPERFEQMGIYKVPAVVVMLSDGQACEGEDCPKPQFEVVYGDVPLDEALSVIANRGNNKISDAANGFLQCYRKVPG